MKEVILIDANELRDEWLNAENTNTYCPNDVLDSIDEQPEVEAEPKIYAHWELFKRTLRDNGRKYTSYDFRCSNCKKAIFHNGEMRRKYKRCYICGAIMKEVENNE